MQAIDLYVKLEDPTKKHGTIVSHHRVYDEEKFMANLRKQHEQCENEGDRRSVSKASQAEYRRANGYKLEHCK